MNHAITTRTPVEGLASLFTVSLMSALLGLSGQSIRRSLIRWPASGIIQANGKPTPAWSFRSISPGLRVAVVDAVAGLSDAIGIAPGMEEETPMAKRRQIKRRSDTVLKRLTESQRQQIFDWLAVQNLSYADAVQRIKSSFGVKTSQTALCLFYQWYVVPKLMRKECAA
jgi:hypothetical protein